MTEPIITAKASNLVNGVTLVNSLGSNGVELTVALTVLAVREGAAFFIYNFSLQQFS